MEEATNFVNAFLVNDLANLLQRAINPKLNPAQQYPSGFDPELFESREEEGKQGNELVEQLVTRLEALPERLIEHFDRLETNRVIELLIGPVQLANQFFQQQTPWKMVDDRERVDSILFLAYETVRISAIFLQPITPAFSHKLLDTLGIPHSERSLEMARFNGRKSLEEEKQGNKHHHLAKDLEGPIFPRLIFSNFHDPSYFSAVVAKAT